MRKAIIPLTEKQQIEELQRKRREACAKIDTSNNHLILPKSYKKGIKRCEIEVVAKSQYEDVRKTKDVNELKIQNTAKPTYRWSYATVQKHIDKINNPNLQAFAKSELNVA